jgi:hypothetical protein
MVTSSALVTLLITLVILGLVVWVVFWGLGQIGVPEPFNKIIRAIIIIVVVVYLVSVLMGFAGHPLLR